MPPALKPLRLCTVETDEIISLLSRAHGCLLAEGTDLTSFDDVPGAWLPEKVQQDIMAEAGLSADDWPDWRAVAAYLDRHPKLFEQ